jgi:hypothetical protein
MNMLGLGAVRQNVTDGHVGSQPELSDRINRRLNARCHIIDQSYSVALGPCS